MRTPPSQPPPRKGGEEHSGFAHSSTRSPLPPCGGGRSRERWALAALAAILVITVGWWAAALWPLPAETPEWVARARAACFGSTESGLPDAGGWILLIGSPLSMLAALLIIGGRELRGGLATLMISLAGRGVIVGSALALVLLALAAYARVATAYVGSHAPADIGAPGAYYAPRLDKPAPPLALLDQYGKLVTLERFRGRPVLLTFAYGKCETVCPVIVQNARTAQERLGDLEPVLLVVTLDPWRDTPRRLPHIAESWQLGADAYLLGGEVDTVESALDAWHIARSRDPRTGEIAHPSLVYILDREGKIAFAVTGNADQIVRTARRL